MTNISATNNVSGEPDFVTDREVQMMYRLSRVTLFHLRKSGKLPHYRVGGKVLYSRRDLSQFFEANRVNVAVAAAA